MQPILGFRYPLNIPDNQFSVIGNLDATKTLVFQVDTQATASTLTLDVGAQAASRTLLVPVLAGTDTLMTLGVNQTVTGILTLGTPLASTSGGTGINNAGKLTLGVDTTITGGGILALAGFTLTVSATGTAALLGVANAFTGANTFAGTSIFGAAVTISPLTAGQVLYTGVGGLLSANLELQFNGALFSYGSGSVSTSRSFVVNGGNSGANNGANVLVQNAGASIIYFGNYSSLLGGAYDATPLIGSAAIIKVQQGFSLTNTTGTTLTVSSTTSASSSITGAVTIGNGVAATSVAIGGGNINAGGTLIVGGKTTHNGSTAIHRVTFGDASYTALVSDTMIATSAAFTAPRTITLPAGATMGAGTIIAVCDEFGAVGAVNTLTLSAQAGETIASTSGAALTLVKTTARSVVLLLCTGNATPAYIVLSNL